MRSHWRSALMIVVGVVFVWPLWMDLVIALGKKGDAYQLPPPWLPGLHTSSFLKVLLHTHWLNYVANSVLITGATILLVLLTSVLSGYALSQMRFRGREGIFLVTIAVMMLPQQALIIPQFVLMKDLHLLNTFTGLILPFAASSSGVFLFRQAFLQLPDAYRDVARLEGASLGQYLRRVAVPLAKPAMVVTILLTFISSWNMFQWPLIMADTRRVQPIELALSHYMQQFQSSWRELTSATVLALLPVVIVFAFTQRHIVKAVIGGDRGIVE